MNRIGFYVILLSCLSCSSIRVAYDYDKKTDFSNYQTYTYLPEMETGLGELDAKRLLQAIDSTMQLKGIMYSEEPDFFINIQSREIRSASGNSVGVGVGGTGGNIGGGVSIGLPIGSPKMDREIIFDLVDSRKDELFWQAVSGAAFKDSGTPEQREARLREIVTKVFSDYPPKRSKR
jgi:hypothetical protein